MSSEDNRTDIMKKATMLGSADKIAGNEQKDAEKPSGENVNEVPQQADGNASVYIKPKKKLMEYTQYDDPEKRPKWIRILCIVVVVILIGLIIATLVAAIAGASKETIMALILCDGIIPIFLWVFLKITQRSLERRKEAEKYYGKNKN